MATAAPPVMEARRWLDGVQFTPDRPLINVSQAAPVEPPPPALRTAMAETILSTPEAHLYGPVLGLPDLRTTLAHRWSRLYSGRVGANQVAITSGCNQAFAATTSVLAEKGDEVILPTPWYFNHKMWLDMQGLRAVPLPTDIALLPDPDVAKSLITDRTRAIVLVTPNNPAGVEYPADLIRAFYELCKSHGIRLIVDETYRDFLLSDDRAHDLFTDPDWDETLVCLYSFSKSYRLTGHRVGSIIASTAILAQVEKFLDTVTICPAQIGQHAALWGIHNLDDWLEAERQEILRRRNAMETGFGAQNDWQLLGCGAYFAYARHPFEISSDQLAQSLVKSAAILLLPGTMFMPPDDHSGRTQVRIAFANIDANEITEFFDRLGALAPSDATA